MVQNTDIVVIGAGIAGMTAAVYAVRAGKRVSVLECEGFGGQIASSPRVENYPGIAGISGADLSDAMYKQASDLGVEFAFAQAQSVAPQADGGFVVESDAGPYACRSVILASGAHHRGLGLPREKELTGHGVAYCAVCDGAFYRDGKTAVVGGGSAALQSAEYLCGVCKEVVLIHRRDEFRGEAALAKRVCANPNLTLMLDSNVVEYLGEDKLTGIVVENVVGVGYSVRFDEIWVLAADGVVVVDGENKFYRRRMKIENLVNSDAGTILCESSSLLAIEEENELLMRFRELSQRGRTSIFTTLDALERLAPNIRRQWRKRFR